MEAAKDLRREPNFPLETKDWKHQKDGTFKMFFRIRMAISWGFDILSLGVT